jgi:hypothetical protein
MTRRREFITLLGGAAAWPLVARAQQGERMRRIGMLIHYSQTDREGQARITAFLDTLQRLGWTDGRNSPFHNASFRETHSRGQTASSCGYCQPLFGGPSIWRRLSGVPKAWLRCGSSSTSQSRFMVSRLVRE